MKTPAKVKPGRMGIAHRRHPLSGNSEPHSKKRRLHDIQDALLADPALIQPSANLFTAPIFSPNSPLNPSTPSASSSQALPPSTFLISTTVNGETTVVAQTATDTIRSPPIHSSGIEGVASFPDPIPLVSNGLHVPGNDVFEGDPLLVEELPSTVLVITIVTACSLGFVPTYGSGIAP